MPLYKFVGNQVLTTDAERAARHPAHRVPQRLPRLLGAGAAADPLRAQLRTTSTSTPRSSSSCSTPSSGSSRCRSRRTTATRSATSTACGTPRTSCWRRSSGSPTASGCSTSAASSRVGRRHAQQPLRPQARLPEQPPVRARRRARGQPRCSTSAPGPAGMAQELVEEGLRGHGRRPVPGAGRARRRRGPPAEPRRPAGLRRPQVRPPAAARRDRAPEGPRAVPRAARRPVRLRPPDAGAHHARTSRSPPSG